MSAADPTPMMPPKPPDPDSVLKAAMYQAVAYRRIALNSLVWQVPALSLTAQAFLFTAALGATGRPTRLLAASLALIIALISMQLMAKHRYHEEIDSRLLEMIEVALDLDSVVGRAPHAHPRQLVQLIEQRSGLQADIKPVTAMWFVRYSSYRLWMGGLLLFAVAAVLIILTTIVGHVSMTIILQNPLGKL